MGLYRGWRGGGGLCAPVFPGSTYVCMKIMPLCLSVEFFCLSVYQFVCLSKSLYTPACLHVSLSPPLSLSPPSLSLSLSISVVGLADQGSRARYWAIQVFSWDSKSVPFPISLSW